MSAASHQDPVGRRTNAQAAAGSSAREVTARRTRTMTTEGTQEFEALSAQDVASFNDVTSKAPVDLGVDARGVSRLSHDQTRQQEDERMPRAFLIVGVLLVIAVIVGGFFLFRAAISSIDGSAGSEESAVYAIDDFSLVAHVDGTGLVGAYVFYVDSINGRCEVCYLDGAARLSADGGSSATSLADIWARDGMAGLAQGISQTGGIEVKTALQVDGEELAQILALAQDGAGSVPLDSLVGQIVSTPGQMISAGALRGLLVTMGDVGREGYIMLNAPTETVGEAELVYQQVKTQDWAIMLAGMRDSASSVETGL